MFLFDILVPDDPRIKFIWLQNLNTDSVEIKKMYFSTWSQYFDAVDDM